jgi:hypothetical protein
MLPSYLQRSIQTDFSLPFRLLSFRSYSKLIECLKEKLSSPRSRLQEERRRLPTRKRD